MTLEVVVPSVVDLQDPAVPVFPSDIHDGALAAYSNMAQDHAAPFLLDQEAVVLNVTDPVVLDTAVEVVHSEVASRERAPFPVAEWTMDVVPSLHSRAFDAFSRDEYCHRMKGPVVPCSDDCD